MLEASIASANGNNDLLEKLLFKCLIVKHQMVEMKKLYFDSCIVFYNTTNYKPI